MAKTPEERIMRIPRERWATTADPWRGHVEGALWGAETTVLFYSNDTPGLGPLWHVHPYDEIFIMRAGRALYTIGSRQIEAVEGDVLLGPAGVPHKFKNLGPGRLETIDIHCSPRWIQTNLPDPELGETHVPEWKRPPHVT
jgi:mannose-6-phosphate isomerase-like protein (cupin superfamily)